MPEKMAEHTSGSPIISFSHVSFYGGDRIGQIISHKAKRNSPNTPSPNRGRQILEDFNLDVYAGEKLLIYGPSGTGKTTLFRLLLGFVEPDEGMITFEGTPVKGKYVWYVRSKTGYVPQVPDLGEGPTGTIVKELFDFKQNQDFDMEEEKISHAFRRLGLPDTILGDSFENLSGGEKQRVGFALSLLLDREVLLLDEPTASLDGDLKKQIIDMTSSMNEGRTILVISHDEAWKNTDNFRVLEMQQ
jgi:putative ABC transport system ATP-binding protein